MSRYIDADEFLENESEAYMRAQVNLAKEHADKTIDATRYVNEAVHKKIQMLIKEAPSADVIEIGKPYKRDKDHVLCFEVTKDDYGDEWWTIRRQDDEKVRD